MQLANTVDGWSGVLADLAAKRQAARDRTERLRTQKQALALEAAMGGGDARKRLKDINAELARHRKRQNEFRRQFGADYRSDLDLIIANPDGTPLKPDSVSGTVSRLCRMLGLPKGASLHTIRHSHASLLLEKGVDLATVSERLGHSSVATTAAIYSHAIRGKDRAAAQVWDDLMQQARAEKPAGVFLLT
jgi:site-specific recombinase XerD